MSGIFISYRREDSAPYAGRLCDLLRRDFPDVAIFMDIDAIAPGEDFVRGIDRALSACRVVVAVIGPRWEAVEDESGRPRLSNPEDYVVRELGEALEANIRIIPVLVGDASMPHGDALPRRLKPLATRQAIELSDSRFVADVERLSEAIAQSASRSALRGEPIRQPLDKISSKDGTAIETLNLFRALVWADCTLGIISSIVLMQMELYQQHIILYLISFLIGVIFNIWLHLYMAKLRNWARMGYLVFIITTAPFFLFNIGQKSLINVALDVANVLLALWLLRMMFTDPLRQLFNHANPASAE